MTKKWYQYKLTPWSVVTDHCASLVELGERFGYVEDSLQNLWYLVGYINQEIVTKENSSVALDWHLEKHCIGILDVELAGQVASDFKILAQGTVSPGAVAPPDRNDTKEYSDGLALGVRKAMFERWEVEMAHNQALKSQVVAWLEKAHALRDHLLLIVTAIGSSEVLPLYTLVEIKAILNGERREYDESQLLFTLREAVFNEEEAHDLVKVVVELLINQADAWQEMETKIILRYTILLEIVFRRFGRLAGVYQKALLRLYFYRSIVLGTPVRQYLSQTLAATANVVGYITEVKNYLDYLGQNVELVPAVKAGAVEQEKLLPEFFQDIRSQTKATTSKEIKQYSDNIYRGWESQGRHGEWLNEACDIYFKLEQASLINWFKQHDRGALDQKDEEMTRLLISFAFGGEYLDIADYFKQEKPLISLDQLWRILKEKIDLQQEKNIDNILKFNEFLHRLAWLPEEQELIMFHEADGQWHWNESD